MLELLYTEDASETELTVKSGSVDVGLGIDVMRVLRAYAKGDPLIGAIPVLPLVSLIALIGEVARSSSRPRGTGQ